MKNSFKGSIAVLFLMLSLSTWAHAERQSLFDTLAKLKTELNLSDEQVEKIKPIIKENMLKRQGLYDSTEGQPIVNKKRLREEILKYKEDMNQKLSKVLSEKQMEKLVQKQHQRESLNKDQIDYSESLTSGVGINPSGASMAF